MAMSAGSVSVADDGTATGTGFSKELYDQRIAVVALLDPLSPPAFFTSADCDSANLAVKRAIAAQAGADAAATVSHIVTNGVARVAADASGDAVQAGTVHPAVAKDIPIF